MTSVNSFISLFNKFTETDKHTILSKLGLTGIKTCKVNRVCTELAGVGVCDKCAKSVCLNCIDYQGMSACFNCNKFSCNAKECDSFSTTKCDGYECRMEVCNDCQITFSKCSTCKNNLCTFCAKNKFCQDCDYSI